MRSLARAVAFAFAASAGACTFGGLAGYSVPTCDPGAKTQAADECDVLNNGNVAGCSPFRCNADTSHCAAGVRDDDRDGNPPVSCGGTDCDDHDPLNGGAVEQCDGHDNNCNGLVDDGVSYQGGTPVELIPSTPMLGAEPDPWTVADTSGVLGNVIATSASSAGESVSECVDIFGLDSSSASTLLGSNGACSFLATDQTLSPRQPFAKRLSQGVATVFVESSGCAEGALGYRWFEPPSSNGSFDQPCPSPMETPALGTALPALEDIGVGNNVALLFYDAPLASRSQTTIIQSCSTLKPAPLDVMVVGYGELGPGSVTQVTEGIATAPVGTLSIAGLGALVATPVSSTMAASIFLVTADGKSTEIVALADFTNARAVGLAAGLPNSDGTVPIVAVGELGCAPQEIVVAFGKLDPAAHPATLTMGSASKVASAASSGWAIHPEAAWQNQVQFASGSRAEWLVTWTVSSPGVMARRYAASGAALSDAFSIGTGIIDAVPGPDGRVFVVDASSGAFESVSLECPPR